MIIDSSALVAIALAEPDALTLADAISSAEHPRVSAGSVLEVGIVMSARGRSELIDEVLVGLDVVAFDREQALVARQAYRRYGRRSGSPARLTFGDCMSYALAITTGEPLLFRGDDFTHTDVVPALSPGA